MKLTKPDLTFLRQLMGNPWINGNVFGENPKHLLGRWQQKEQFNPWVLYIEELSRTILTSANIKLDTRALAKKLDADYGSTLAEMECAVFLAQQGFSVTLEPTAPEKGPDIRADWDETPYFVEVRALGDCEEDDRFKSITRQLFSRLNTVRSSYSVAITVGDEYFPGTSALKSAIDAVLESLNIAKEHKWKSATLYHSPSGTLLNPGGDFSGTRAGHREIVNKADFIARFTNLGEEREKTTASTIRPFKDPPKPDQTHERLKKILSKKRTQLPKNSRGIIVFDVSELFMLTDFSVESALYGDLVVTFPASINPGEPIGELGAQRNNRGFFRQTSRVSAVVIHKRVVENATIRHEWKVYPTNRGNPDTIRLNLAELRRFGELGDREHLTAENAPNPENG
ncbi:MAG TPA: hypothetical protein VFB79_07120 [Candidatus Angelobacter sp.]|nr:hypothetical protein [Candidatus Angelobacter sp.]